MAISIRCKECNSDHRLGTAVCRKCGKPLAGKYRVAVKNSKTGSWKTQTCNNLTLARQIEAKFKTDTIRAKVFDIPDENDMTMDQLWDKYFAWAKKNKRSFRDDYTFWTHYIGKHLGKMKVRTVKTHHIQSVITAMQSTNSMKFNRPFAPATLKHTKMFASRLFNWAIAQGYHTGINPAKNVKVASIDNRVTNPLNKNEIMRLLAFLDTWENERAALVIKYALYSGKRKGEILGLKWENIDLSNGFVTYVSTNTKNKTTQTLPINEECLQVVLRARAIRKSEWVFPCQTGEFYHSFTRTWTTIKKHLNITIRFHDLRHTFATYLASSGDVDIYTLQHLLGHKDIKMTQRYAHLLTSRLKKAVDSVSYE